MKYLTTMVQISTLLQFFYRRTIMYQQPKYTPEYITKLEPNEIFVFGSNTQGRHGKGAAKQAMSFGAVYGQARGLQGNCYALITKELRSDKPKFELCNINQEIEMMYICAKQHPELVFLVTKIGCGLGGYSVSEIAELFHGLDIPSNVVLPKELSPVLTYVNGEYVDARTLVM